MLVFPAGLALQSAAVWMGAYAELRGTNAYAAWADRELPRTSDGKTALHGVDERLEVLSALLLGDLPYDAPERTEQGLLTSARVALTGNRKEEDARYW